MNRKRRKIEEIRQRISEQSDPRKAAEIIIDQLGGKRQLSTMVGAENFLFDTRENGNPYLQFQFKGSRKADAVQIELDRGSDLYTLKFFRGNSEVEEKNRISASQLQSTFENVTGLDLQNPLQASKSLKEQKLDNFPQDAIIRNLFNLEKWDRVAETHMDEQTADLLLEIMIEINDRLQPDRETQGTINRLKTIIQGGSTDERNLRNQIFKAADSLGLDLPSGFF